MASVFEKARSVRSLLAELGEELEPGVLDVNGAKELVDIYTQIERFAVSQRGRVACRVDDGVAWKRSEHRSAAEWFSQATGVPVGAAAPERGNRALLGGAARPRTRSGPAS